MTGPYISKPCFGIAKFSGKISSSQSAIPRLISDEFVTILQMGKKERSSRNSYNDVLFSVNPLKKMALL